MTWTWPAPLRSMRHRNYRLFFGGQLISLIGTWMQTVAESWLTYRLTGRPSMLGLATFCSLVPVFLLSPLGGAVSDRVRPQRLLVATQTASMLITLVIAILVLGHRIQVWQIFVAASMLGVVNGFDIPARQVFVAQTVEKPELMNAIALNSSMFNGARIVGPAVAGLMVAKVGEGWCFLGNSISYLAVIAGLLMMQLPPKVERSTPHPPMVETVLEGFRYVKRTGAIRTLILLIGLSSLLGMPYSTLMPIFADRILHGGAGALGALMGASGVGALLGALSLALKPTAKGLGGYIAGTSCVFGLALVGFSASRHLGLSVALMVPVGYCFMVQMAACNTLIQMMVPDALRGRVISVYAMMFMGMAPLGALVAGQLAGRIGTPWTVAIGGFGCFCAGLVFLSHLGGWRSEARALIAAQH